MDQNILNHHRMLRHSLAEKERSIALNLALVKELQELFAISQGLDQLVVTLIEREQAQPEPNPHENPDKE